MIPQGLPGRGNILIFDNGGWAGYGAPNPASADGVKNAWRDYSRILEINPLTLDIEWRYSPYEADLPQPTDSYRFYSPYISNMQRLENGNTLINEGSNGRIFEVTRDHDIVWEYISPFWGKTLNNNMVYRAYRIPYAWIPQLAQPQQTPIAAVDVRTLRQPGAAAAGPAQSVVRVAGVQPYSKSADALCVATDNDTLRRSPKLFRVAESAFRPISAARVNWRVNDPCCCSLARSAVCTAVNSGSYWPMKNSASGLLSLKRAIWMPTCIRNWPATSAYAACRRCC